MPHPRPLIESPLDFVFRSAPWRAAVRAVSELTDLAGKPERRPDPDPLPDLGYRRERTEAKVITEEEYRRFRLSDLHFPPRDERAWGYPSRVAFRTPRQSSPPWPGAVILPIYYDSKNLIASRIGEFLSERGYATFQFRSRRRFFERVRLSKSGTGPSATEIVQEMIVDARRAADWLEDQPDVDGDRLGIAGVSQGGMIGVCAMGSEPRFRAGAFLLAGGNLAKMLLTSQERGVRTFREGIAKANGLSTPQQIADLHEAETQTIEPLRFARHLNPRNVLLIKTARDRVVIPETQDELWEALGRPRRLTVPLGHISAAVAFYVASHEIHRLFEERLR